jgi:taurine transport system substrate-binding protein
MPRKRLLPAALAFTLAIALAGCGASASTSKPGLKVAYFEGAVAGPDAVVAANPDLASKVAAKIQLRPIDSGVAGMAQLRAGAFPVVSGVGNPPFLGAVASGTDVEAVFVESNDQAGLVVSKSIKSNADLKKVGVLVGSTLDFEFRGWAKTQGLSSKVQVASFASEAAEDAAWKAHQIDAVYISQAFLVDLVKHGGRVVVTAPQIAQLGYAAVNLLAVSRSYARSHPDLVQQLVCQVSAAQTQLAGPQSAHYITPASRYLGVPAADAIAATKGYPYVPKADETAWLQGADGTSGSGKLAANLALTGQFLVSQGRASSLPSASLISSHIDPSFWRKVESGGCK